MRIPLLVAAAVALAGCTNPLENPPPASQGPALEVVSAELGASSVTVAFYARAPDGRALTLAGADFVLRGSDGSSGAATVAGVYNATSAGLKPGGTTIPAGKTRLGFATFAKPASATATLTMRWTANTSVVEAAVPKPTAPPVASGPASLSVTQSSCTGASPIAKFTVVSVSAGFAFSTLKVTDSTTGRATGTGATVASANSLLGLSTTGGANIAAGDTIIVNSADADDMTCSNTLNFVDTVGNVVVATITLHG